MAPRKPVGRPPKAETVAARKAIAFKAKYDAAGQGRRLAGWNPPASGPNRSLEGLQRIRNRARDASRNDWSGESAIQKWTTSLVGIGITPRFKRIKDKVRKQELVDLWNDFAAKSDADCVLNVYGQQTLVVRSWLDGGEVFARRRPRFLDEGLPVPVQVQLIEAEFCPMLSVNSYTGLPVGNVIRDGIELNKRGKRVAYWFYKEHPGDGTNLLGLPNELVRVAASEVTHIFEPKRPGQLRGVSMLAPVLNRLKTIENYDDATLTRQQLANLVVGFITRGLPTVGEDEDINPLTNEANVEGPIGSLVGLQPGLIQELGDGEKVEWSNPPEAGTNYPDYMRTQHMGTSAAAGLPYELFSGDIKEISDRTLRVIINEFRRFAEQRQWQIIIPMFCQVVVDWFVQAGVLSGVISADEADEVRRVEHAPHGWQYIHPVQDPQGKKLEVDSGFRSRSSVIAERGDDADMVDDEIQADDLRQQAMEIGPYSKALVPPPPPEDEDEDEDEPAGQPKETPPNALERALIARANAEARALDAQAKRAAAPPPAADPADSARLALQQSIVNALELVSGQG